MVDRAAGAALFSGMAQIFDVNLTPCLSSKQRSFTTFIPDHIVRSLLDRCRIMVSFMDEQAPRQTAVRRKIN
jgi:hypothetical protein